MQRIAVAQNNVYQKHQSFDAFSSRVGSDMSAQKARIVKILQTLNPDKVEKKWLSVLQSALQDIKKDPQENPDFRVNIYISDEISKLDDAKIPKYIYHRYRYDVYPEKKILDNFPPYLQIEPTSVCNFRCVFCYQTDENFANKSSGHMGSMPLDTFKRVVDQAEGNVEFLSLASRGEPLVCKDIDAMLEYSVGKFLGLKINTNASLLNEKHAHAILSGGISTVVFSADAAEEPLYSQLRVGGKLEKILRNIELFNDIRRKHYSKSQVITRVAGVKVKDDQNMDAMLETWDGLVEQVAFVKYNPWENVYDSPVSNVNESCSDLWRRMFVWHDGKTNPCDTDYKSTLSVGTIHEHPLSQLWLSQGYESLRKAHQENNRKTIEPCRRCTVI
jgi:radical SAM protein with 4Fe4S-binding SPASM domain